MKKIVFLVLIILAFSAAGVFAKDKKVAFNEDTYKYHKIECKWAKRCTRNCIVINKKDAQDRGGVPCKVCGG